MPKSFHESSPEFSRHFRNGISSSRNKSLFLFRPLILCSTLLMFDACLIKAGGVSNDA